MRSDWVQDTQWPAAKKLRTRIEQDAPTLCRALALAWARRRKEAL